MRKALLPLVAAVMVFALAGNVFAADPIVLSVNNIDEQVGEMTVHFTVTDDSGQESTLRAQESLVTLDGRRLDIISMEKTYYGRQPASIILLVDTSGSMFGAPIVQAQAAVRDFIALMEPDDRIAIMSFASGVTLLQDFTTDRSLLDAAVNDLTAFGDTALFAAVDAAVEKTNQVSEGSKLIVLLSDGVATEGLENRETSLISAEEAGSRIITVGLGPSLDVDYLRALAGRTGGRYVVAASADDLRRTYSDIARSVTHRYFSDYVMRVQVPDTIDRTVDGNLRIETLVRTNAISTQTPLGPLDGAVPPPYEVRVTGLASGGRLSETASVGVRVPEGRNIVSVEFMVDDTVLATGESDSATFDLAPSLLETGTYTLGVRTLDDRGGVGYGQISFLVPPPAATPSPPPQSSSFPFAIILFALIALGVAYALYRVVQRRLEMTPAYVTRSLTPEPGERLEDADQRPARVRAAAIGRTQNRYRGRVIVMHESAIAAGDLSIREFELGEAPLTVGTGRHADIRLEDETGMIADEEARIWIQRGRITYHRLTALSAMATAGVTSGWEFFDNGDELRVGGYRFVFQVEVGESQPPTLEDIASEQPQEHGMTLRRSDPFGWDNR